ncbi:hypothetical protein P43SY_003884 [Pythium insidiosum]|uniref:Fatty acid hydroxylase domain-containing protein n=1 Tax=Pythium insidiosum TaxID=114742 RepID=A0AAD5LE75_PYTIN|nr:hypothetical protein P43SY_003884 [Pythium insidiosum]
MQMIAGCVARALRWVKYYTLINGFICGIGLATYLIVAQFAGGSTALLALYAAALMRILAMVLWFEWIATMKHKIYGEKRNELTPEQRRSIFYRILWLVVPTECLSYWLAQPQFSWSLDAAAPASLDASSFISEYLVFVPKSLIFEIIFDFFHFAAHWTCHQISWLYQHVHKRHHWHLHPCALSTYEQDGFDLILTNVLPFIAASRLSPALSPLALHLMFAYKTYVEVAGHSGLEIKGFSFPQLPIVNDAVRLQIIDPLCVKINDLAQTLELLKLRADILLDVDYAERTLLAARKKGNVKKIASSGRALRLAELRRDEATAEAITALQRIAADDDRDMVNLFTEFASLLKGFFHDAADVMHSKMADSKVAELDALLAGVVANAERLRDTDDAAQTLQELLEPLRTFVLHVLAESDGKTQDPNRLRAQQHWSDAATKIQALVRGKHERGQLHRQLSFHLQGTKVLRKYVLKKDRFPQCHVMDTPDGEHAPNFRRLEGTPLYGSAQPTVEGVKHILSRVAADGFTKVVWVNLREEAVIYVDGTPFTARRSAKLNENDLVPGITGHTVQVLESSLKSSLQEQLMCSSGVFEYWHEVALHENELVSTQVDPSAVKTLPEIYEDPSICAAAPGIASIRYIRIPIERENAPEHADVEKLMELIHSAAPIVRNATSDTAFVFNCQMGKRRTTTALVLSALIWQRPSMSPESASMQHLRLAPPSSRRDGSFAAIRQLEKELPFGREAKRWVDAAVDQCAAILNIRSVIHEYHELSNSEAKPQKRSIMHLVS